MKRLACLAFVFLALTSGAMGQSIGEKTGINAMIGKSPSTQDFVTQVAISDMFEIQSSKLAEQQGNGASKQFAGHMVQDHTKTSTELKGLVSGGEVKATLPTALDKPHQGKLDKLKELKGNDFSKQYDDMQVSAHKDAVSLFERYASGGEDPKLKEWAGKTLPKLQQHLKMAQDLQKGQSSATR